MSYASCRCQGNKNMLATLMSGLEAMRYVQQQGRGYHGCAALTSNFVLAVPSEQMRYFGLRDTNPMITNPDAAWKQLVGSGFYNASPAEVAKIVSQTGKTVLAVPGKSLEGGAKEHAFYYPLDSAPMLSAYERKIAQYMLADSTDIEPVLDILKNIRPCTPIRGFGGLGRIEFHVTELVTQAGQNEPFVVPVTLDLRLDWMTDQVDLSEFKVNANRVVLEEICEK